MAAESTFTDPITTADGQAGWNGGSIFTDPVGTLQKMGILNNFNSWLALKIFNAPAEVAKLIANVGQKPPNNARSVKTPTLGVTNPLKTTPSNPSQNVPTLFNTPTKPSAVPPTTETAPLPPGHSRPGGSDSNSASDKTNSPPTPTSSQPTGGLSAASNNKNGNPSSQATSGTQGAGSKNRAKGAASTSAKTPNPFRKGQFVKNFPSGSAVYWIRSGDLSPEALQELKFFNGRVQTKKSLPFKELEGVQTDGFINKYVYVDILPDETIDGVATSRLLKDGIGVDYLEGFNGGDARIISILDNNPQKPAKPLALGSSADANAAREALLKAKIARAKADFIVLSGKKLTKLPKDWVNVTKLAELQLKNNQEVVKERKERWEKVRYLYFNNLKDTDGKVPSELDVHTTYNYFLDRQYEMQHDELMYRLGLKYDSQGFMVNKNGSRATEEQLQNFDRLDMEFKDLGDEPNAWEGTTLPDNLNVTSPQS